MPICLKCNCCFPNHVKINDKPANLQNRKFCLLCSPYKHHNTRDITKYIFSETEKFCPKCNTTKPIESFYKTNKKYQSYCKSCNHNHTVERQKKFKQQCIDYKGGKCQKCNYNKCFAALEFHHLDPTKKDFTIGHLKNHSFKNSIKEELDKCILVCANCHREIHYKYPCSDSNGE